VNSSEKKKFQNFLVCYFVMYSIINIGKVQVAFLLEIHSYVGIFVFEIIQYMFEEMPEKIFEIVAFRLKIL